MGALLVTFFLCQFDFTDLYIFCALDCHCLTVKLNAPPRGLCSLLAHALNAPRVSEVNMSADWNICFTLMWQLSRECGMCSVGAILYCQRECVAWLFAHSVSGPTAYTCDCDVIYLFVGLDSMYCGPVASGQFLMMLG